MVPESPAPHRHISSHPISLTSASQLLQTFLKNSESHPHLHPDALITPTGVTFSSHGGPFGGVVMHNLRRVAAGLRGEYLEPEATPEAEAEDEGRKEWAGKRKGSWNKGAKEAEVSKEDGWQDQEVYEQSVQVEVDELGKRHNFVAQGGDMPEVEVTIGDEEVEGTKKRKNAEGDSQLDKDARKKAKKERNKELKRQKEKERAHQA